MNSQMSTKILFMLYQCQFTIERLLILVNDSNAEPKN